MKIDSVTEYSSFQQIVLEYLGRFITTIKTIETNEDELIHFYFREVRLGLAWVDMSTGKRTLDSFMEDTDLLNKLLEYLKGYSGLSSYITIEEGLYFVELWGECDGEEKILYSTAKHKDLKFALLISILRANHTPYF